MKRLVLVFVFWQLACMPAVATFETDDPLQQIEALRATQEAENASKGTSLVTLDKRDYLKLIVGTYVNGFNEFDTTIWTSDELVKVGIYFDPDKQDEGRAGQLAEQFREQLPLILGEARYKWASDVEIEVGVHQVN